MSQPESPLIRYQYRDVDGVRMFYREAGDRSADAVAVARFSHLVTSVP